MVRKMVDDGQYSFIPNLTWSRSWLTRWQFMIVDKLVTVMLVWLRMVEAQVALTGHICWIADGLMVAIHHFPERGSRYPGMASVLIALPIASTLQQETARGDILDSRQFVMFPEPTDVNFST